MTEIKELGLSTRAVNVLRSPCWSRWTKTNIETVEELEKLSDAELLCRKNLGLKILKEIRSKLKKYKHKKRREKILKLLKLR